MKEYSKWCIGRSGGSKTGKYYAYFLKVGVYTMERYVRGNVKMDVTNHISAANQIGLIKFIVDELINKERTEQNVISSVTKMLKRLNRI